MLGRSFVGALIWVDSVCADGFSVSALAGGSPSICRCFSSHVNSPHDTQWLKTRLSPRVSDCLQFNREPPLAGFPIYRDAVQRARRDHLACETSPSHATVARAGWCRVAGISGGKAGASAMDEVAAPKKEGVLAQQAGAWVEGDVDGAACLTTDSATGLRCCMSMCAIERTVPLSPSECA